MSPNDETILKHYQKVAKNFGLSAQSTMADQIIRNTEVNFVLQQIKELNNVTKIIDIGCGNGHLLEQIHTEFPQIELTGLEFTPELHKLAQKRNIENCEFILGDARSLPENLGSFDMVITERSLINILTWEGQLKALTNISQILNQYGHYLMIESFKEPLRELNKARKEMQLPPFEESYQNRYFNKQLDPYMKRLSLMEKKGCMAKNHLSTHFYTTRVLHPVLKPQKGRLKDTLFAQFFNQAFPASIGNYSPIQFRLFEKL